MPEKIAGGGRVIDIRASVKQTLASIGYYRNRLEVNSYGGVAVLTYHAVRANDLPPGAMHFEELHVTAARLDEHCRALGDLDCTVVSLAEWASIARGERPIPPRAVMLTFDDGYRSVLEQGVPVLERWNYPATVFICTDPVERQVRFWFDAVAERDGEAGVERTRALDFDAWRRAIGSAEMRAEIDDVHAPLTVGQLRRLASHPLIAIGAHTVSHPVLSGVPLERQIDEIARSRTSLEAWLERPVTAFAYPGGQPGADYDARTIEALMQCGFEYGFTTVERFARVGEAALEHARFTMLQGVSGAELAHRLAVSWPREGAAAY
jgi:peptidoglycan/xylan/chitin deacetylase (PgdA/CDA1 family)